MEVSAKHRDSGDYELEIGPVLFTLNHDVIEGLEHVIKKRLNQGAAKDEASMQKKLSAYRNLATKMGAVDDKVVQKIVVRIRAEQLVTMVRLAEGKVLYNKVLRNLSTQNRRQFEDDYKSMNKITEHQAIVYMEQIVPILKHAAQEQKKLQNEMS